MKGMYKKSTVLGIVLLLLVISIVPTTGKITNNDTDITLDKQLNPSKNLLFDRYINFLMEICQVPSLSICTINKDEVLWSKGYGHLDLESEKEATSDTIFWSCQYPNQLLQQLLCNFMNKGFLILMKM